MDVTPRIGLPYIAAQQAQKQVTYNEAMQLIDLMVQPVIKSRMLTAPPGSPTAGDVYLVAASPTGGWSGKAGQLAAFIEGAWSFVPPRDGWLLFVEAEGQFIQRQSGSWMPLGSSPLMLGVNTAADSTTRFAVAAAASRLGHEGGDHRLILDKANSAATGSQIFQTGASGRAEIGLTGDDNLHIKVSADGSTWKEALRVDRSSGGVTLPQGRLAFPAVVNPSGDANTLDDYREGSWTPGIAFGGAATGVTYGAGNAGSYTRIGRLCIARFLLKLSSKGSASGNAELTGLPFTAANDGIGGVLTVGWAASIVGVTGTIEGVATANATTLALYSAAGGAAAALTSSAFANSSQLQGVVIYDVA